MSKNESLSPQPWNLDPSKRSQPNLKKPSYTFIDLTFFSKEADQVFRVHIDEFVTENEFKKNRSFSFFYSDKENKKIYSEPIQFERHSSIGKKMENYPFFSIETEHIAFSKNKLKFNFTQSDVSIDLHYEIKENNELTPLPFAFNFFGPNKTHTSFPHSQLNISGSVQIDGNSISLTHCIGFMSIRKGLHREPRFIRAIGHRFYLESGEPAHLSLFAQSLYSPTYLHNFNLKLSQFIIIYNGTKLYFNNFKNFFNLKQSISETKWSFQFQHQDTLFKVIIQSQQTDMFIHRLENTDSSLLFKTFSMNADIEVNVFEKERLTLRALSTHCNVLESNSIHQNSYIHNILE